MVITIVVVVIAIIILIVLNYRNSHDCVTNASNARDSTSVKLVVNYRRTNNCGAFRRVVNFGLCGEMSREAHSIDIHRNIRFL